MTDVHSLLKQYWGYDTFRPQQEEIIQSVMDGKDTVALLPTGGGKSLCYQLPALALEGKTIVISPLIALMHDQISALKEKGITAIALHSGLRLRELETAYDNFIYGPAKLLYVSPERLKSDFFTARIQNANLSMIAVDEAHCISQWGHDFRPAYMEIGELRGRFKGVPVMALTATATKSVVDDIVESLEMKKANIFQKSFSRDNISFVVIKTDNKRNELLSIMKRMKGTGIIYVRNRKMTKEISDHLNKYNFQTEYYHAGLGTNNRTKIQEDWKSGKTRVIVSTNAFGMGIDKSDVRFVIHTDVPPSIEEYYQEAGRAGRDGEQAFAITIISNQDVSKAVNQFQENYPSINFIKNVYHKICVYLKIATGSGLEESFDFDLIDFCETAKLPILRSLNAIDAIVTDGWITMSDGFYRPSQMYVSTSKRDFSDLVSKEDEKSRILRFLLRRYEGLFIEFVKIDEQVVAKNLKLTKAKVVSYLQHLDKEQIIKYEPRKTIPLITFLQSRPQIDSFTINVKLYNQLKERSSKRLSAIIDYLSQDRCRQRFILEYFGEKKIDNCGTCDICRGSNITEIDKMTQELLDNHLLQSLATSPRIKLYDYLRYWPHNKRKRILTYLQESMHEIGVKLDQNYLVKDKQ